MGRHAIVSLHLLVLHENTAQRHPSEDRMRQSNWYVSHAVLWSVCVHVALYLSLIHI